MSSEKSPSHIHLHWQEYSQVWCPRYACLWLRGSIRSWLNCRRDRAVLASWRGVWFNYDLRFRGGGNRDNLRSGARVRRGVPWRVRQCRRSWFECTRGRWGGRGSHLKFNWFFEARKPSHRTVSYFPVWLHKLERIDLSAPRCVWQDRGEGARTSWWDLSFVTRCPYYKP